MSNLITLVQQIPTPLIAGWLLANVIPYLSALATKAPTWTTGAFTILLSFVDGFLSEWASAGDNFDWKAGIGVFFIAWATARLQHRTVIADTNMQARLHQNYGIK